MASDIRFYRSILNEAIRLGKSGKQTNRLVAAGATKASNEDQECAKSNTTQITTVITQSQKGFETTAMGTLGGRSHPLVKTFCDVLFRIKIDGANQLHRRLSESLGLC